jgi:RNA polymerase subunit RPABC4/transcription elongation factor Spt4
MARVLTAGTVFALTACDGGMGDDYAADNVRWCREIPPSRSEYSSITFSRQFQESWIDCIVIEDTNLSISAARGSDNALKFDVSTPASRVHVDVTRALTGASGTTSRNLGLVITERVGGIVHELPAGKLVLSY